MTGAIAIIPARLGSERFPAKVLADETGSPLLWHVHEAARRAPSIERVVIATDSEQVRAVMTDLGAEAVLTGEHPNGTSRLAEAAATLRLAPDAVVVNVQGDEPEIESSIIDACVAALTGSACEMATVGAPFAPGEDPTDPNIVKVVRRPDGRALYFSRARIPFDRSGIADPPLKHVGLYAYRAAFLARYVTLAPTPLEQAERLEQLRALEHGHDIMVALADAQHHGIDTPEQYAAFVRRWQARGRR